MDKRKITPAYAFFYVLFLPDTYRLTIGLLGAWLLAPSVIASQPMSFPGKVMIWIMLIAIGYAATGGIANRVVRAMKKFVLKDKGK